MHANMDTLYRSSSYEVVDSSKAKDVVTRYWADKKTNEKEGPYFMSYKKNVLAKGSYSNNIREGLWRFYRMDDVLQTEGHYVKGKKDGKWRSYYPSGELSYTTFYKDGQREKTAIGYFPGGDTSFQKNYVNNSLTGESKSYYKNGQLWLQEFYEDGKRQGISKTYYDNGTIKEEVIYKNDERDSIYKYYYDNGILWEHIIYRNGGVWNVPAYNDPTGKAINCCTVKDGNGIMRFYDKEGKLLEEYEYNNTQKNGFAKYYKNGKLDREGNYKDNEKEGVWKGYFESGVKYYEITYSNGKQNGAAAFYDSNGKISRKEKYIDGSREDIWTSYDENGNVQSEITYKNNRIDGACKYYFEGSLSSSGKCINGTKVGTWTFYKKKKETVKALYSTDYPDPILSHYKDNQYDKGLIRKQTSSDTYTLTELMPAFPGKEIEMMLFLKKNINYPFSAMENNVTGTVYITFIVTATGEIEDAKILRGVHADLDEEALNTVNSMPIWSAGMQSGEPVRVQFNLPIKFSLR